MNSKLDNISAQFEGVLTNQRNLQSQLDKQSHFFEKFSGQKIEGNVETDMEGGPKDVQKSLLFMSELEVNRVFKDIFKVFKQVEEIKQKI